MSACSSTLFNCFMMYLFWLGVLCGSLRAQITPSQTYPYRIELVPREQYVMFWDHDDVTLTVELHVKTLGYVGWGLSPNGGMQNSDISIAWVKDGQAFIHDYFAYQQAMMPRLDVKQDLLLISGHETATHTVVKFRRDLDTCNVTEDRQVTLDTSRVIFSWSDVDPVSETSVPYHGATRRGTKTLALISSQLPQSADLPSNAISHDFLMFNVSVPSASTTYWCQGFRNPFTSKVHGIRADPIIKPGNEGLVHHMILYGCANEVDPAAHGNGWNCFAPNMAGFDSNSCTSVVFSWAVGGTSINVPAHVGFPFEAGTPKFFRLEMHYDNPTNLAGVFDTSGFRIWATPTLRENEGGALITGLLVSNPYVIPPQIDRFRVVGHCRPECLTKAMSDLQLSSFRIFAYALHTHLMGRAVRVRHFRNGVELPVLASDETYDFNFQDVRLLKNEVVIQPGDRLITECDFDSTMRSNVSFSGFATTEEMCLAFLYHYPRLPLTDCYSYPLDRAVFTTFNIPNVLVTQGIGYKSNVGAPGTAYQSQQSQAIAPALNWTRNASKTYENIIQAGETVHYCADSGTFMPEGQFLLEELAVIDRWTGQRGVSQKCSSASSFKHQHATLQTCLFAVSRLFFFFVYTFAFSRNY